MELYEVYERALEIINRRGGWAQLIWGTKTVKGELVELSDDEIFDVGYDPRMAYCIEGACMAAVDDFSLGQLAISELDNIANEMFGVDAQSVNDGNSNCLTLDPVTPRTARNRVRKMLKKAIRKTKAEAAEHVEVPQPAQADMPKEPVAVVHEGHVEIAK